MQIEIVNPRINEATRTSANRAEHLCRTGQANMMSDGRLFLLDAHRMEKRSYIARGPNDPVYWNGSNDPNEMNLPGMVRS